MRLGPYTLDQELGRGTSGVVYRGRSPEGRPVAVKLLAKQSPEVLERFQREARLHEQLGAEAGFVPFLDMGLAEGRPYLVMPHLPGGTLRDRLQRGPLSLRGALELGQRLATALGRAHALGIVHRDVKPENVLFDDQGHAFLADLGMAKHFRHDVTGASQSVVLSQAGEVRGTVSYMPPEQLKDASSAGPPADVFSLGAVLYECLSGEPPFNADTYVALLVQIAGAIHVPLRKRCECPPWFDALIEASLTEDPAKRPGEGLALAALLAEGPAGSAPGGARARRVAGAILGLSLAGSALAGALLLRNPPEEGPSASPTSSALLTASPSPSPEDTRPPGHERFPAAWAGLLRSEHLTLTAAWKPPGVSHAGQVTITQEGVIVTGEESVFALGEGPPLPLISGLPGLRRWTGYALDDTFFVIREKERLRLIDLAKGTLRCDVAIRPEGRLAAVAFGGVSTVVAHGKQLATYGTLPGGEGKSNPNFATLPETPYSLAASRNEVVAGHGNIATFLNVLGKVTRLRDYGSPIAELAYRGPESESPQALVATRDGRLHVHDEKRGLLGIVETGLDPLQGLCVGQRFAALVGEKGLVVVDLETRQVIDRLDLSGLGIEVGGVGISPEEDALAIGTEDGQVLRYDLTLPGRATIPTIEVKQAWGERRGRHAQTVVQALASERWLLSADGSGAIQVWDPETGESLRTIRTGQRSPCFVLGDSDQLWAIDLGRLRRFDVTTGHETARLPLEFGAFELSLRPDEVELAILGLKGEVEIRNLETRSTRFAKTLPLHGAGPRKIALLPDGSFLLGYPDGALTLHDPRGSVVWTRQAGRKLVTTLELLSGGEHVLVGCADGQVSIWSLPAGQRVLRVLSEPMTSLSLSGDRILVGLSGGELELRSATTGEPLWRRDGGVGIQPHVALRSERELFLGGADQLVRRVELDPEGPRLRDLWAPIPPAGRPLTLGFTADARPRLTTITSQREKSYDPESGRELSQRGLGTSKVARWGRTNFLTSGSAGRRGRDALGLDAWNVATPGQATRLVAPPPRTFALSADGRVVAYPLPGQEKGVVILRLDERGGIESRSTLPAGNPLTLHLSAQGELLLAVQTRGVETWSLSEGKRLRTARSPAYLLNFLATRSRTLLLETERGGLTHVSDARTGEALGQFTPRQRTRVDLVLPSPEGERLALAFPDGSLELWRVPAGERLARLQVEDPRDPPRALAFSDKGDRLALVTGRGRVLIFDVPK